MNTQPIEKHVNSAYLDVFKIWDTIQGEGPFAGTPAVFVRLAGCNLQCPLCDTDYTSWRQPFAPEVLADTIQAVNPSRMLVVITGGEPFRQSLSFFACELARRGIHVQVETNGTYAPEATFCALVEQQLATIVCSPKTPHLAGGIRHHVNAWKYVLQAGYVDEHDGLPTRALGCAGRPARPDTVAPQIYIQPLEHYNDPSGDKMNVKAAVASCLKYGYRLCLQLQKIIGLE